jgi:hypothetical protein
MSYRDSVFSSSCAVVRASRSPNCSKSWAEPRFACGLCELRPSSRSVLSALDVPDFSKANEPYVDGGGIYAPRPRRAGLDDGIPAPE